MNNEKLSVLLGTCLIPGIAEALAVSDEGMSEFLDKLYRSEFYDILSRLETGAWRLSAVTLAGIYLGEVENGILDWPEEQ